MQSDPLLPHQAAAVEWMQGRESNPILGVCGGMIFDEPGLGKTRTMLELLAREQAGSTLIVVPARVMAVWILEIERHFAPRTFAVYTLDTGGLWHMQSGVGSCREVVLASYNQVMRGWSVFARLWHRIVLDESHYIRNESAKTTQAVLALDAERTWIITATPMFNGVDDIYTQLRFLSCVLTTSKELWREHKNNLQVVFSHLAVRRTYVQAGIELAPVEEERVYLEFSLEEREFYDALYAYTRSRCEKFLRRHVSHFEYVDFIRKHAHARIMHNIIRLRQACCTPELVATRFEFAAYAKSLADTTDRIRERVSCADGTDDECCICMDAFANVVTEPCGHFMCMHCCLTVMEKCQNRCPLCRTELSGYQELGGVSAAPLPPPQFKIPESTKLRYLMDQLDLYAKSEKIIVFSQWTTLLDIVDRQMPASLSRMKLTGKTSPAGRAGQIAKFQHDPDVRVALCSLTAMSEGITLTAATRVYFLDDWWTVEKIRQAKHRVIRIGQQNTVRVFYIQIRNTIEDYVLSVQRAKIDAIRAASEISLVEHVCRALQITNVCF